MQRTTKYRQITKSARSLLRGNNISNIFLPSLCVSSQSQENNNKYVSSKRSLSYLTHSMNLLNTRHKDMSMGIATRDLFTSSKPVLSSDNNKSTAHVTLKDFSLEDLEAKLKHANIAELIEDACVIFADKPAFGTRVGNAYEWMTYRELGIQIQRLRNVLISRNIQKNDKVAIISNNRVEWAIAMYAVATIGAQLVPMYEAQLEKDWLFILNDSNSKLLFVGSEAIYSKTKGYIGTVGKIESIISFDAPEDREFSYKRLMKHVENEAPVPSTKLTLEDHLVLIYTSGTTGNPKGVVLSHGNATAVLRGLHALKGSDDEQRSLAFLPWAHVFGQMTELHSMLAAGNAIGIVSNREQIVEGISLVKPTIIFAVPMLLNKVYDGVMNKVAQESNFKRKLVQYAFKVSRDRNNRLEFGQPVPWLLERQFKFFDKLVFSKIRERLGGNLRYMGSGGAAASLPVLHFFEDIGIPIAEGYGLTETAPVITSSTYTWQNRRLGCVGTPIPGADIRICNPTDLRELPHGQDGEICYAGPNVMVGYHNNPKADAEVFFERDGKRFFRTGDMGRIVDHKFLKLTGRIKEQFKLLNGKFVVPAASEEHLIRSQYISQAFLYGDNQAYTVALITPDYVELAGWVQRSGHKLPVNDNATLVNSPEVKKLITEELVKVASVLKSYERPRVWLGVADPFTPDNQLMTPKMSLRRNNIMKVYGEQIAAMYRGEIGVAMPKPTAQVEEDE